MSRHRCAALCTVLLGVALLPAVATPLAAAERLPALGLIVDSPSDDLSDFLPPLEGQRAVYARIHADWQAVEFEPGHYDWSALEPRVDYLHRSGYRVILGLTGSNAHYLPAGKAPSPLEGSSVEGWLGFVRSAVRSFAGRVEVFELWSGGDDPRRLAAEQFDPATYAFILKSTVVEAQAEANAMGRSIRIAQAPVTLEALEWQRRVWGQDSAAYVDVLPMLLEPSAEGARRQIEMLARENLSHPPAAELWAYLLSGEGAEPWEAIEGAVEAAASGVSVALATTGGSADDREEQAAWIAGVDRVLGSGFAPAPTGDLRFLDDGEQGLVGARVLGRFFSDEDFSTLIVYRIPGAMEELPRHRLVVDTAFVRNPRLLDPVRGGELRVSSAPAGEGRRGRVVRVTSGRYPGLLFFEMPAASEGFELPPEQVETTRSRELTAEEIIARYQQVQETQDDALERWTARARIDFHFKFALGGPTIDVGIDSNYFWERGSGVEWEQTDYYIQGNKVSWKNFPQIPFIQPEKVATLPLDLTLDKTYTFRLVARDRVGEHEAYVLDFRPTESNAERSLYRGRVWIDTTSFVRLKATLLQTNMEAPVLSNEERDHYRAEAGPHGSAVWMLDRITGEQLWTVAGRNLVVRREVRFLSYEINPPQEEFDERRDQAYASKNQMLRDTEEGFRYLERQKDGTRVVTDKMKTSQLFAAVGAFKDNSTDGVQPLAGVNYFDFDLFGGDIQFNVLFGGVVAFVNASKPSLFGRNIDLTGDLVAIGIKTQDKVFTGDEELELERIRQRNQLLSLRLGIPTGKFAKFTMIGRVGWNSYFEDPDADALYDEIREETDGAVDLRFVLPPDHKLYTGAVTAEYNRRGYTVGLSAAYSRRSDWDTWGLYDDAQQSYVSWDPASGAYLPSEPAPVRETFSKWGATAFKEWILTTFQKVRFEIDYLDGDNLDRFSQYRFSQFGDDQLNGFSGSGVRFDRGGILRGAYAFNVLEAIRFSVSLENAQVEEVESPVGLQSFTGLGLSFNVVGPWKTVWSGSWGYALASDIPDLEGQQEFFVTILKLF
jgi:hypothetical protein